MHAQLVVALAVDELGLAEAAGHVVAVGADVLERPLVDLGLRVRGARRQRHGRHDERRDESLHVTNNAGRRPRVGFNMSTTMDTQPVRIDKWLWAARLVKTRALAVDAIRGGRVKVNGAPAKPSKDVRPGDEIEFSQGVIRLTATIRGTAERRLPASEAVQLYTETEESRDRARAAGRRDADDPPAGRGPQRPPDQARAPRAREGPRAAHGR